MPRRRLGLTALAGLGATLWSGRPVRAANGDPVLIGKVTTATKPTELISKVVGNAVLLIRGGSANAKKTTALIAIGTGPSGWGASSKGGTIGSSPTAGAGLASYGGDFEPTAESTGGDGLVATGGASQTGTGGNGGEVYGGAANKLGGRGVRAIGEEGGHAVMASGNLEVAAEGAVGSGAAAVVAVGGTSGPTGCGPGVHAIGGKFMHKDVWGQPGSGLVGFGGVRGETSASANVGVWGRHVGGGVGVYATGTALALHGTSEKGTGAHFSSYGGRGVEVTGTIQAIGAPTNGLGLRAESGGDGLAAYSPDAVAVTGTSVNGEGGLFSTKPKDQSAVHAENLAATPSNPTPVGAQVYGDWVVQNGVKSAAVPTSQGQVLLYAVEGPVAMFEDVGAVRLAAGRARVELDPIFVETIEAGDYFVFLSPRGETAGVYVASQDGHGFEVREQGGGTSAIEVSYRIVAKRKGLAPNHRLAGLPTFQRPALPSERAPGAPQRGAGAASSSGGRP